MVYFRERSVWFYNKWLCVLLCAQRFQRAVMFYTCYKRSKIFSCLLILFALYALIWYIGRSAFSSEFVKTDRLYVCLEDRIKSFNKKVSEFDAFIIRSNNPSSGIFPFVGNGYIGCSFQENKLLLLHSGYLSQSLDIPVLISLDVHGYLSDSLFVLDIYDGIIYKMHCFKHENELCVSSGTMAYAHRLYTSLIVQNFRVYNPLDTTAVVRVNKDSIPSEKWILKRHKIHLKQKNLPDEVNARDVTYEVIFGLITLPDHQATIDGTDSDAVARVLVLVLFEPVFPDNLSIAAGKTQSYSFITGAKVSDRPMIVTNSDLATATDENSRIGRECVRLQTLIHTELVFALQYPESELRTLHTTAWNRIWYSGVTLSYSFAPSVLNGKQLNATLYYLLSNTRDLLSDQVESNKTMIDQYKRRTTSRQNCSSTRSDLLRSTSHWIPVNSVDQMVQLVRYWRSYLIQSHCGGHLDDGAHGILQAVLLNLGAFQLHDQYTSVGLLPNKLDRDLLFRRIQLHESGIYVNVQIRIIPGELSLSSPHLMVVELSAWRPTIPLSLSAMARARPPRPSQLLSQPLEPQLPGQASSSTGMDLDLLVQVEREAQAVPLFVCPAGCQSTPIQVRSSKTIVPFLETIPPTSLLYFGTRDATHLMEYGQQHSYLKIQRGPHPDHDIITLHRHGHAFGGLPWLFWISLGLLITLFHLFFCKIIYNELWKDSSNSTPESWHLPRFVDDLRAPEAIRTRAAIKAQLLSRRRNMPNPDSIP